MSEKIAIESLDYFFHMNEDNDKELKIYLIGGEPLLNFNLIQIIIFYCKKYEKEHNRAVKLVVVSSGLDVTESHLLFFEEYNIWLYITLDINEEIFNKNKKLYIIKENIKYISKNKKCNLVCRCLLTKRTLNIINIFELFDEWGVENYVFLTLRCDKKTPSKDQLSPKQIKEKISEMFNYCLESNDHKKILNLLAYSLPLFSEYKTNCCEALNKLISVGTNGELYPCHRFFGLKNFTIGSIQKGISENIEGIVEYFNVENKNICKECEIKYFCGGTCCFCNLYSENEDFFEKTNCEFNKQMFLFSVKLLLYIRQSSYNNYISLINKLEISTDAIVEIPFNLSEGIELNRLKKSDNVDCVDLDSEGILFFTPEQKKQEKYIVNTSTMAIWDLLDGNRTAQDITQEIANVCEVEFETIKDDIYGQLAAFQELGLVEEVQEESHA